MDKVPDFNQEQIDWISYQIGEWYLYWKRKITDENTPHRLGYAKEVLKQMICPMKCTICNENYALFSWENCFECEIKHRADHYCESKL